MSKISEVMKVLACPKCKGDVDLDKKENKILCQKCRLKYPILEGGIPDMLIGDAEEF